MARKSKTQKAKASAARAQKRVQQEEQAANVVNKVEAEVSDSDGGAQAPAKGVFKNIGATKLGRLVKGTGSSEKTEEKTKPQPPQPKAQTPAKAVKKEVKKPERKKRFKFLRDVRQELKRVTWPTREDVLRWSVVVVVALLFFGIYSALLDNAVVNPVLYFLSGFSVDWGIQ